MIAQDTIEEKILKLQERKKNLADEIVTTENISSRPSRRELLSISQSVE